MPAAALKKKPRIVEAALRRSPTNASRCSTQSSAARRPTAPSRRRTRRSPEGASWSTRPKQDIETLRAKIAAADETDVKRAATLVRGEKPSRRRRGLARVRAAVSRRRGEVGAHGTCARATASTTSR